MNRIERPAATLGDPLLVTGLVNVQYLTGFESSNTALLVDPSGDATLYTDFRYAEAARAVPDVTFEQTPRQVVPALAERLSGRRIGVEASHITLADADTLRAGGVELVSTTRLVEALRAVKDAGEPRSPGRGHLGPRLRRALAAAVRRPHRGGARLVAGAGVARGGRGRTCLRRDRRVRRERRASAREAPRRADPEETLVVVDAGCLLDGYRSDCTRTFFTGEPEGRLRELYDLCLTAQLDALAAVRPGALGKDVDAVSRKAIGEADGRALRPRARPRRRARGPRGAEHAARVRRGARAGERRDGRAGDLPRRRRRRPHRGHGGRHRGRLRAAHDRHEGTGSRR